MQHLEINGYSIDYEGEMDEEELKAYLDRGIQKFGKQLHGIECKADGEFVDIYYNVRPSKFTRLRRITGYLVGDLNRWNNGKRAEEKDRVKHETE